MLFRSQHAGVVFEFGWFPFGGICAGMGAGREPSAEPLPECECEHGS